MLAIIDRMMVEHLPTVMPSGLLGKALQYMSGQWPKLICDVENANWPIANKPCEKAIRPFVMVERAGSADTVAGANASANLYSLVENCKANEIEPYRYLVTLFQTLPFAQT